MMARRFLDHHSDPATQLMIPALDGQRVAFQQKESRLPQMFKKWHVELVASSSALKKASGRSGGRIVRVDAGDLVGIDRGPIVFVDRPPRLMPMNAGVFDRPCLVVGSGVPGVPCLVRVGGA